MTAPHLLFYATLIIDGLLALVVAWICILAFVRSVMAPANMYTFNGKRSKNFWMAMTGGSAAVGLLGVWSALSFTYNPSATSSVVLFQLVAATISSVFLAGVWPAVGGNRRY
ncbi:DUF2516 family protein [Rothia dentocariosa]|uniref:DUF2516 family protein n=1 Tax=Rothia dentocariosa TaxID=2047 RepID=UPI0028EE2F3E|nr:DUF2516 family protein [Rothia dentocariosa]